MFMTFIFIVTDRDHKDICPPVIGVYAHVY